MKKVSQVIIQPEMKNIKIKSIINNNNQMILIVIYIDIITFERR